ncbi:hypothetical protein GUITHDRAFT_148299 [Guillardia theta CCMP2712]|uniref:Uncharacterized protein n=1 Tax=Guillardia theta (strain CCMP2712) TaxID=905079 RepID=L1I9J7_GUITC|nr:hypothetical protein GUITHDRAFT_148299 [Guillardia theta CCMP2712]EKX32921.1 hypothetical protein GUITHDRAFT_148299 [Guillardia theta CCMP2712]|eukprot:XP_005819901.1 hypothetical protein GUITHDRAFT_148299 [Guillardia theta CCMP2712]
MKLDMLLLQLSRPELCSTPQLTRRLRQRDSRGKEEFFLAEKTFLVGSKEWFESMKETRQDISSADAVAKGEEEDRRCHNVPAILQSGGSKDVSKNVSSFEVLKRELDAPKPTANKAPLHENKASDLLEKERLNANKSTNAPRIVAASHTSRRADEIKKTIIRREVKEVEREGALVGVQNVRAREAEAEEGREGEEEDQEGEREGEEAGAEKEEERKLFRGELSGNVLSDNEARLVGSSPTPGQCQMVVFSFGVDYKITFDAGDLVLVPRSKGGLCFGVLESRKTDAKKRVFWNVELGAGAVKPVPEPMLGKSLSGICAKRSEEINNIRAIGKEPTQEDLRSVIFGLSSKFDKLEVVLVPCARGGFAYGYIADCDGNHHYLVKSSM